MTALSTATMTAWRFLMDEACISLARAGVDAPEVDARRIVEEASGAEPHEWPETLDAPTTALATARFESMLARRCAGEPLQYVLGRWGFRTLDLMVDQRVLIPRPETETVAEWAISQAKHQSAVTHTKHQPAAVRARYRPVVVVDLGTGSGAIALSVAVECSHAHVHATDISSNALAVAKANLAGLGRAAARVTLHVGDWFDALPSALEGSVDVVVSNPPYVGAGECLPPVVADWEPPLALRAGPEGNEHITQIIAEAPRWLRSGGSLVVEMAPYQCDEALCRAHEAGFSAKIERDLADRDRALVGVLR